MNVYRFDVEVIAVGETVDCYLLLSYCLAVNFRMFFDALMSEVVSVRSVFEEVVF